MTTFQKVIKNLAIAFAIFLIISIIGGVLGIVGLIGGISDADAVLEENKAYSVTSEIKTLEIDINAADVQIEKGSEFSVESNLKYLDIKEKGEKLVLSDNQKFGKTYKDAKLKIIIPEKTVFEEIEINTGAGRLTADTLSSGSLKLSFGAGEVAIGELNSSVNTDIDGGAGKITVSGGSLAALDLDMGIGKLELKSKLVGNCELDFGVGESNITLLGGKDNYALDIEKGLGNITVDGKLISDFEISESGDNRIDIDGGVGAINISFE